MKLEVCWRVREDDIRIHLCDRRLKGSQAEREFKDYKKNGREGKKGGGEGKEGKLEATE